MKIGQYLLKLRGIKLRRTKKSASFFGGQPVECMPTLIVSNRLTDQQRG